MAMRTIEEVLHKYECLNNLDDLDITDIYKVMKEYGEEVIDSCVAIAMAVDITNTSQYIQGKSPDAVWREIVKIKNELK